MMTQERTQTKNTFVSNSEMKERQNNIPDDWIPVEEAGLRPPKDDADVFDIRMNNQNFLYELWRGLAGMTYVNKDGRDYLRPMRSKKPLIKPEAAMEIISYLRFLNNPSVVLGNIKEEEFSIERDHVLEGLADLLADKDRFGISHTQRKAIMSFLSPLIGHQLSRAIKGFEANNLITHIAEERGDHRIIQNEPAKKRGWLGGSR